MIALNNGRATLNEKAPGDQHNDEGNVNEPIKVLVLSKRMQALLLMMSNVSYVIKVITGNINAKNAGMKNIVKCDTNY